MASQVCPCEFGFKKSGQPKGKDTTLGGLRAYICEPSACGRVSVDTAEKAVLLITDVYGYELTNTRLVADSFAEAGFLVVVPDFFDGDYWTTERSSIGGPQAFSSWLNKHNSGKIFKYIGQVLEDLRSSYHIKSIGVNGYCWGAKYVILLGGKNTAPEIKAIAVAHPSFVEKDDIDHLSVPSLFCCAENDTFFTDDMRTYTEQILSTKKKDMPSMLKVYPGTSHGFAVRGDPNNDVVVKAAADANRQAVEFFKKYL